jgi:hypothetical protein
MIPALLSLLGLMLQPFPAPQSTRSHLTVLPDNACELLTAEEMSAAVNLPVTAIRDHTVTPASPRFPGRMCMYETGTEFGTIATIVLDRDKRTSGEYWSSRHASFEGHRDLTEYLPSFGKTPGFPAGFTFTYWSVTPGSTLPWPP